MSLLHPAILFGLGLMALPVILHLLLKQKPKKLLFPALQLIANRRKQNVSRMRLRHFWLMLLRMLVIGLLVFAIARPSVPAADYSLNVREILTSVILLLLAIGAYVWFSHRWKSAALPRHEQRLRQTRLRSGLIAGVLVLLLLLVGWPYQRRIAADLKAPTPSGDVSLPVAAVFLFDTSLSMTYQQEGRTRLAVAQQLAVDHLSDLASGSRVAVADVASDNPILFQTTMAGAKTRIESLTPNPVTLPLNDRIRTALRLHADDRTRTLAEQSSVADDERTDRYLRRVYVLTDLSQSAFRLRGTSRVAAELEAQPNVHLFLVDVSQEEPINAAITSVKPSRVRLASDGSLQVQATVARIGRRIGAAGNSDASAAGSDSTGTTTSTVELLLGDGRGKPVKVAQQSIELPDETPQVVTFANIRPEGGPIIHGDLRLVSSDPLPFDDVRHFTVEVRPPIEVLVVAPSLDDAEDWATALEVQGYQVTIRQPPQFKNENLSDYRVISLVNIPALPDNDWYRLGQYVEQGGGLAVFLGSADESIGVNYRREEAQVFLPGRPVAHSAPEVSYFRVASDEHPLFARLESFNGVALLEATDVYRFWRVEASGDTRILARYSESREAPALLERLHGAGRTIMLTTAVDVKGFRKNWNYLASPQGPIEVFLAFADEMMRYLSGESEARLTYDSGETPILRVGASEQQREFLLQHPGFRQSRVEVPVGDALLSLDDATEIGHYDLKTSGDQPGIASGFSVNAPASESDLTRVAPEDLDELFGEERYQLARSIGELNESINIADLGRELFPLLLTALILFFLGEHFVANWFYDEEGTADVRASWTSPTPEPGPRVTAEATAT